MKQNTRNSSEHSYLSILLIQVSPISFRLLNIFLRKLKMTSEGQSILSIYLLPQMPRQVHSVGKFNKTKWNVREMLNKKWQNSLDTFITLVLLFACPKSMWTFFSSLSLNLNPWSPWRNWLSHCYQVSFCPETNFAVFNI